MLKGNDPQTVDYRAIILQPLVTEKSMRESQEHNKYSFRVASSANKVQIRRAIEVIFNVRVLAVNTMNVHGKMKQRNQRYRAGKTARWKKAVVTLAPGSSIDILEGGL